MLFQLFYGLIYIGWFATTVLMGGYISYYADAREMDLGLFFMIAPLSTFARPIISSYSDRKQSHQKNLVFFLLMSSLSCVPFIAWPYYKRAYSIEKIDSLSEANTINWPFLLLSLSQLVGSLSFCGARALGDAAAVNYGKKTGSDFSKYRVYGSYTYGTMGYLIGFVNENNGYLPDFVPGLLLHCLGTGLGALVVYAWPAEYFDMSIGSSKGEKEDEDPFPRGEILWRHVRSKLSFGFCSESPSHIDEKRIERRGTCQTASVQIAKRQLSLRQQLAIFTLLVARDFRIPLYLALIAYTGFTAYAGLNFVFTYADEVCRQLGTCSGSKISALMMSGYCVLEAIGYKAEEKFQMSTNARLLIVYLSVVVHYYFYGFLLDKVSPYWFLVESLHGIEYAFCMVPCVDLGYKFSREVDLIIPELIERGTISDDKEEQELTRVSLSATMTSLFTLVFEGVSCTIGAATFGLIAGYYSFKFLWIFIGTLAIVGVAIMVASCILSKLFDLRPKIIKASRVDRIQSQVDRLNT